jgi:glutathione synthase/RimK-type ligase-like ATP-grasp enzyme
MAIDDIPTGHEGFAQEATTDFLQKGYTKPQKRTQRPYDLAILVDPELPEPPSNKKALQRFAKAGEEVGFNVEFIQQEDYSRIGEFDALFIRETTGVNHHTFRFACRAEALGLVVIDDPALDPALQQQGVPGRDGRPAGHPGAQHDDRAPRQRR